MRLARVLCAVFVMLLFASMVQAAPKKGDKAPAFQLDSIAGKTVSLDDLRKDPAKHGAMRPVVIEFGSTG